jgi:hypothetical protein
VPLEDTDVTDTITRRSALTAVGAGILAAAGTRPAPVAAEPLSPADELVAILDRAAALMLGPLRWDDEARSAVWGTIADLETLVIAADPQNPPRLPGWPANA